MSAAGKLSSEVRGSQADATQTPVPVLSQGSGTLEHVTAKWQVFPGKAGAACQSRLCLGAAKSGDKGNGVFCPPLLSMSVLSATGLGPAPDTVLFPVTWACRTDTAATTLKEGLAEEFGLPPCCKAQLHTHSRSFVSSCATGVHIFQLFFQSSSDLSLGTHGRRVALLRSGCPAQPSKPEPLPSPLPKQAHSAPNCSSTTEQGQIKMSFCLLTEHCGIVLGEELTQHLSQGAREMHKSHLCCSFLPVHAQDESQERKGLQRDGNDHPHPETCHKGEVTQGWLEESLL